MKKADKGLNLIALGCAFFSHTSQVTAEYGADEAALMERMQAFQMCLQTIDQAQLAAMEKQSRAFQNEVNALCQRDQRDDAQALALEFSLDMASQPVVTKLRECQALMGDMSSFMPQMADSGFPTEEDIQSRHICD
ncbi:MAG: hypothetical protein ACWA5K_03125 [bacterium]